MNALRRLERRWLGLPPARSALIESSAWMRAPDGARLAARVWRPADPGARRGTVLLRTEHVFGRRAPRPIEKLARWLAEDGHTVVIQSCRGRGDSEGDFEPFIDEAEDGGAAVRWVTRDLGCAGELLLFGLGYSAYTAWAALSAVPEAVGALVVGFGARDPYAWLYPGGALALEAALALAAQLDGRSGHDPGDLDFARAARHRPVVECDRVAIRELAAFREWIAHPQCDDWWRTRTPPLPAAPPRTLFAAGWYECALSATYADYETAAQRSAASGAPPPAIVLGPWSAAPVEREERVRGPANLGALARSVLAFAARGAQGEPARGFASRVFVRGDGWREVPRWARDPDADRTLYLRSSGQANSLAGDGRLAHDLPDDEPPDTFVPDPADPVPSLGGASVGRVAGSVDQAPVEERGDVLCFTSAPLGEPLVLLGRVAALLYLGPFAGPADTTAKLAAVEPGGAARWLCEGIARVDGTDPDRPLEIDLGVTGARLAAGTRLRLEITGSSLPRFARAEGGDAPRARPRVVHHDRARPSALHIRAIAAS